MDKQLEFFLLQFCTVLIAITSLGHGVTVSSEVTSAETDFQKTEPALLVVSYDAFRPEYFRRGVTPHMNEFRTEGTSAEFIYNVFPTKTFPNHHSIATVGYSHYFYFWPRFKNSILRFQGFYPKSHGILANSLYDSKLGELGYSYDLFHYNESIWPIWVSRCGEKRRTKIKTNLLNNGTDG